MDDAAQADQIVTDIRAEMQAGLQGDDDARRGWVKSRMAECPKCGAKHERYSTWFGFNIKYLAWRNRIRLTCSNCSCPTLILPKDFHAQPVRETLRP